MSQFSYVVLRMQQVKILVVVYLSPTILEGLVFTIANERYLVYTQKKKSCKQRYSVRYFIDFFYSLLSSNQMVCIYLFLKKNSFHIDLTLNDIEY